jgi:transaldolase
MPRLDDLSVKIFADGADRAGIAELAAHPWIKGFTTNPTLMRAAGVDNVESFARDVIGIIGDRPVSFEVFSDDFADMERQALKMAAWGDNVYVKVPVTNTAAEFSGTVIRRLAAEGVRLNVTALMTLAQVRDVAEVLRGGPPSFVSVFAGRIADSGRDPLPIMSAAIEMLRPEPQIELIWASPREVLNLVQADSVGCHIITVTHDLLKKLPSLGRDLDEFSLDTVKMFHRDGLAAGFQL